MMLDDAPVGIFQTYEPDADPIGEHYPVRDGDFGIHLFMAPAQTPIQGFTGAIFDACLRSVGKKRQDGSGSPSSRTRPTSAPSGGGNRLGVEFGEQVELPHKTAPMAYLSRP